MTKIQLIPYFLYLKYQQVVDKTSLLGRIATASESFTLIPKHC